MIDFVSYLMQSKHNESLARYLLSRAEFRDWAITAAFYSAIHFVNAALTFEGENIESNGNALIKYESLHTKRQNLVRSKFGNTCYKEYRFLRLSSEKVRYLENYIGADSVPSLSYFDSTEVRRIIEDDLNTLKVEIKKMTKADLN